MITIYPWNIYDPNISKFIVYPENSIQSYPEKNTLHLIPIPRQLNLICISFHWHPMQPLIKFKTYQDSLIVV